MKTIGLSTQVYEQLLWAKHLMEKEEKKVMSFDEVIFKLIRFLNGEEGNVGDKL